MGGVNLCSQKNSSTFALVKRFMIYDNTAFVGSFSKDFDTKLSK